MEKIIINNYQNNNFLKIKQQKQQLQQQKIEINVKKLKIKIKNNKKKNNIFNFQFYWIINFIYQAFLPEG